MTSLIAWVAADTQGPSGLYLASDSRITWFNDRGRPVRHWDSAKKLFTSRRFPILLGFAGDVQWMSQALGQIVDVIDAGCLPGVTSGPACAQSCFALLSALAGEPVRDHDSTVFVAHREGRGTRCKLTLFRIEIPARASATMEPVLVPGRSMMLSAAGSGKGAVRTWVDAWAGPDIKGKDYTSRSIFSGFCDAVASRTDSLSGGPAQLVGLDRTDPAKVFGTVRGVRDAALMGVPVSAGLEPPPTTEWRNELLERVDFTGKRLPNAQRHSVPKHILEKRRTSVAD